MRETKTAWGQKKCKMERRPCLEKEEKQRLDGRKKERRERERERERREREREREREGERERERERRETLLTLWHQQSILIGLTHRNINQPWSLSMTNRIFKAWVTGNIVVLSPLGNRCFRLIIVFPRIALTHVLTAWGPDRVHVSLYPSPVCEPRCANVSDIFTDTWTNSLLAGD